MRLASWRNFAFSASLLALASCNSGSSDSNNATSTVSAEQKAILVQFSTAVIVPTYKDLAAKSLAMQTVADAFVAAPSQAGFDATRAAWIATRIPWERSEAFLFGPVDSEGYDPAMDSWPLEHAKLENVIAANVTTPVDVATQEPDLKGFHAIEFLLWGFEQSKNFGNITTAEETYLKQLVADHARITALLSNAWSSGDKPFVNVLSTAGEAGNDTFTSTQAGVQEIFEAMIGIADEVGTAKIAGPFDSGETDSVESQYSYNSLIDFQDNIVSLRNVWYGTLDGSAANASLSSFVKARDATLEAAVTTKITAAIHAIGLIPEPFRSHLKDPAAAPQISAAIAALADLRDTLDTQVRPVVLP